ncbi:MAG TPA: tRNA dihydrouridine synthase DusB [Rubricoccaceae bacterium]|jgi:nifR3 family TIM-barrel protein|nr:tRNA dihydrouridine synthase DusB [Rubricoccaceae bacterium]
MRLAHLDLGARPLLLAPMEDVSDPPFRILCKRYGADLLYTEFISSGGLVYGAEDSVHKLEFYEEERPLAIQIFGGEEDQVREAARIVDAQGPDLIDINFGCPVRKVVCKDAGAGILRDLPKMERLTAAVVEEATRPVTVKTRLGWNDESIRIEEVARMLEDVGVAALAVHARTRSQMYRGDARWDWFPRIRAALRGIPLIGNGDATTPEKVRAMFDETGVDAVMIGRGAIGNPWIFRDAKALLETGEVPPPPSWAERVAVVAEHLTLKCAWLGERRGVLEMRRQYGGYFKGHRGASQLRARLMALEERDAVLETLLNWREDEPEVLVPVAAAVKPAAPARLPKPARLPARHRAA